MEKQQNRNFGKQLAINSQPLRISQCVGNQFATIANFAMCWQPVRNIAKFASHMHCSFVSHKNFKTLAKFRIANFANYIANFANYIANIANHIANFANHFAKFAAHCQIRKPIAKFANHFAKFANHFAKFANHFANFATALPNSQSIAKFTSFAKFTFAGFVILCN